MKHLIAMLALQQTAAVVLKRAAAATPQAFERATGLRVLHMSPAVVVVDKPTGLRSVPAYGPTRALPLPGIWQRSSSTFRVTWMGTGVRSGCLRMGLSVLPGSFLQALSALNWLLNSPRC